MIIGCDFHTRFQQIAMLDVTTGEVIERRLEHENGDVEKFYGTLPGPARVGVEATINAQWFERMLALQAIVASRPRRQWSGDERSGKNSQTAIDPAPGSKKRGCLLTTPTTLYMGLPLTCFFEPTGQIP